MYWSCPDHPVVHIIWNIFKKSVVRKWQKYVFQSSKRNIQCLEKKRRKCFKSYHQGLHQNLHQHQFSNYIDKFDLFSSTASVTSITSTKQESVIWSRKVLCTRSNSSNHKLSQYFLLHSFQKKTTLVQICWLWACATYE